MNLAAPRWRPPTAPTARSAADQPVTASPLAVRSYAAVAAAAIAGYFLLPSAAQNLTLLATNLVACVTVLVVLRRRRLTPTGGWLLLAGFPAATAVGNAVYFVNDSIRHVAPFPSVGDAAFLGGYLLLAAGLLRMQHARSAQRDLPAVLDTAIITVGFATASYVVFVAPLLHDPSSSLLERLTALGYPVADVLVLAVAARFLLTTRRGGPAFGWLAGTVLVMLVADTLSAVLNLLGTYRTGHPVDTLILAYNLGWGAVALQPRAAELALPAQDVTARPSRWRLGALTSASLVAPVVLVVQVTTDHLDDVVVTAGASALLFLLVVGRMAGLVRALEGALQDRGALQSELTHRAHHDDLTGLANRRMFTEALQSALDQRPDGGTCVLFLDLDRFKSVNDSMGHAAGDTVLTLTAGRLRAALHPDDTVARLGGDEFAVLLGQAPGRSLPEVRDGLAAVLDRPLPLHGLDLNVSASIGTAVSTTGDTIEDLMHRVDTAMYAQKGSSHLSGVVLAAVDG